MAGVMGAIQAGAVTFPVAASVPNNALHFLGASQYVEVSNTSDFNLTTRLTIEAWVNVSAFDKASQAIVAKGDDWALARFGNSGSKITLRTRSGNTFHDLASVANLNLNQWYHIAAVYDGSTKYLYVNGVLDASVAYTASINLNTLPVQFGANASFQTQRLFKGTLDTVRIWSVARTPQQIAADIDRDLAGDDAGLLGEWRFNEPSGTEALDSSAGVRHAVLKNMVQADRFAGIAFRAPPPAATLPRNALLFEGDDRQFASTAALFEPDFDLAATPPTMTVETWVNITAFDKPWQAIVTKGEAWGLTRSGASSRIAFRTGGNDLASTSELLLNRWYHVAGVLTGTQKELYIDGVLESSIAMNTGLPQNNYPVIIGGNAEVNDRALKGRVDSVRLWSVARTPGEISGSLLRQLRGSETGLVADWRFNEPGGPGAVDSSYAERHAFLVNLGDQANRVDGLPFAPALPALATVPTAALRFTGAPGAGRVLIPSDTSLEPRLDLTDKLTIEAWVNVATFDKPWQAIVTKGEAWGLTRFETTSKIAFRTHLGFAPFDLASTRELPTGRWHHVAAVFDGFQKLLYIDGVLDSSTAFSGPLQTNDRSVALGGNDEIADRAFKGQLDAVRIWAGPRTAKDIAAHLDRDLRGNEPDLIGEWRLDEPTGTVALDSSANQLHGALTGMSLPADRVNGLLFRDPADGDLAVRLDQGIPQFVTLPAASEGQFDFPNQMTVEFWVYFDALPVQTAGLVSKGAAAWAVNLKPSGKIEFITPGLTEPGNLAAPILLSGSTLPIKEWHHVAVTWNPAAQTKEIYINGLEDAASTGLQGTMSANNLPVLFGATPQTATTRNQFFTGALDEVRIWAVARSGSRLLENYSRNVNGTEPQLVGVWRMNEGSGLTVLSSGPLGNLDGTLSTGMTSRNRVEGPVLGEPLARQYALTLNGVDEYIEVPDKPQLNLPAPPGHGTFEAWIRPRGTGFRTILYKGASGYGLALDGGNVLRFFVDALPQNALSSSRALQNDVWQHVAVVINGSGGTTTFYIDGKPAGVHNSTVLLNSPGPLLLGRFGAGGNYFNGDMDEVRIWSTARSPLELGFLGFRQLPLNNPGLAAYYAFNEGSGGITSDGTLNHNDGVLKNMDRANWSDGQFWPVAPLEQGILLTMDPSAKGLWVGQITLGKVNEVQKAINGTSENLTLTADAASIKVLLHVGASGQVHLLKDVIVMQTQPNPQEPNTKTLVLVTDPKRIGEFKGIVNRGGKLVGLRQGTASYDFAGHELPMLGGVGPGVGCVGAIQLPADFVTNPFRHKYHPDHGRGYDLVREFSLQFDGAPGLPLSEGPGYGVHKLTGLYRETITGLHKIPLKTEGSIAITRISTVDVLNNSQF